MDPLCVTLFQVGRKHQQHAETPTVFMQHGIPLQECHVFDSVRVRLGC